MVAKEVIFLPIKDMSHRCIAVSLGSMLIIGLELGLGLGFSLGIVLD